MIQHHHLQVQQPNYHHHGQGQFSDTHPRQYMDHYGSNVPQQPHLWQGPNDQAKNASFPQIPYQNSHSNFCHGVGHCNWNQRTARIPEHGKPQVVQNVQPAGKSVESQAYNPHQQPNIEYNHYLSYSSNYSLQQPPFSCNSNHQQGSLPIPLDHYPPTPFSEDLSPPPSNHSSPRSAQATPHLDTHHVVQQYKNQQEDEGLVFDTYNDSRRTSTDQKATETNVSSFGHDREDVFFNVNNIYNEIPCHELLGTVSGTSVLDFCTDQIQIQSSTSAPDLEPQSAKTTNTSKETPTSPKQSRRVQGTKRRYYTPKSKTYSTSVTARQAEEMLTSLRESIEMQIVPDAGHHQENSFQHAGWPTSASSPPRPQMAEEQRQIADLESESPATKMIKFRFESNEENQNDKALPSSDQTHEIDAKVSKKSSHSGCSKPDCKKHHRKRRCRCKRSRKGLDENASVEDFINNIHYQLTKYLSKRQSEPMMLSKVFQVNQEESLTINLVMSKTVIKNDQQIPATSENELRESNKTADCLTNAMIHSESSSRLEGVTKFKCLECDTSFSLSSPQDVESICDHISNGLIGSNLTSFSTFYQSCKFRVKLIVKPCRTDCAFHLEVTAETMVACTKCNKSSFSLDSHGLQDLGQHLDECNNRGSNFCIFCDQQVSSLKSHLEAFKELHLKRIKSLSVCFCKEKFSELQSRSLPFVQCSLCKSPVKLSEPRLAHWMTSTTCDSCISAVACEDFERTQPGIIFCRFCQQGQFGYIVKCPASQKSDSSSICVKCLKVLRAFEELRNGQECRSYVQGMLNELRGKLAVLKSQDMFHNPQNKHPNLENLNEIVGNNKLTTDSTISSVMSNTAMTTTTNNNNVKKVAIVTPEPRLPKEKEEDLSKSIYNLLIDSNPKLNIDKCSKVESNISQKSFISLCNDFSRGFSPLLCRIECFECQKVWNLNRRNMKEVHSHLFNQKLAQNSTFFDRLCFILTCKDRAFPTSTSICFASGFKCKNCKNIYGNYFNQDFGSHFHQCFEGYPKEGQHVKELKMCQGWVKSTRTKT